VHGKTETTGAQEDSACAACGGTARTAFRLTTGEMAATKEERGAEPAAAPAQPERPQFRTLSLGHTSSVNSVAWSADGRQVFSAAANGVAMTWLLDTEET